MVSVKHVRVKSGKRQVDTAQSDPIDESDVVPSAFFNIFTAEESAKE